MATSSSTENVGKAKTKKQLGRYCVAGGPDKASCKNNSTVEGISMHRSPKKEGKLRDAWIKFIQKHRHEWKPSPHSSLCSVYFESRFFLQRPDINVNQVDPDSPFHTRRFLDREIAYPTIDTVASVVEATGISPRERRQVCNFLLIFGLFSTSPCFSRIFDYISDFTFISSRSLY